MAQLSVNINKLALLRNSRGGSEPNLLGIAKVLETWGVLSLTVHPRPDERHIRFQDVRLLTQQKMGELNVEGYPSEPFLALIEEVRPEQVTLVPDPPEALTSDSGWNISDQKNTLRSVVSRLSRLKTRISVFVDVRELSLMDCQFLHNIGVHRVELYTEEYAREFGGPHEAAVLRAYKESAILAKAANLGVNAGHDLNLKNLATFVQTIPEVEEVSIGHALICDALWLGLKKAVFSYKEAASGLKPRVDQIWTAEF